MKRYLGIAVTFALMAGMAQGGGIGGIGGVNGLATGSASIAVYDTATKTLWVPGRLDERIGIVRRGTVADPEVRSFTMEQGGFARLQKAAGTRQVINARARVVSEDGSEKIETRSYRAEAGDEPQQVKMIDRRAAMRSEVKCTQ